MCSKRTEYEQIKPILYMNTADAIAMNTEFNSIELNQPHLDDKILLY